VRRFRPVIASLDNCEDAGSNRCANEKNPTAEKTTEPAVLGHRTMSGDSWRPRACPQVENRITSKRTPPFGARLELKGREGLATEGYLATDEQVTEGKCIRFTEAP
jgi:hypothetical protein